MEFEKAFLVPKDSAASAQDMDLLFGHCALLVPVEKQCSCPLDFLEIRFSQLAPFL